MKIVYCSDAECPSTAAHGVQIVGMCDAFSARGDEVILLGREFSKSKEEIFSYYGVKNPFKFVAVDPGIFKSKRLYGLAIGFKLRQLKPDLVYSRCLFSAFFSSLFGFPTIYEAHTPPRKRAVMTRRMLKFLLRSKNLQFVVAISKNVKADLFRIAESFDTKIIVLPTGAEAISSNDSFELSGNYRVAYAGNFYKGKGLDLIVPLATACPEIDFHLAGDISQLKSVDKFPANIHLHGHLPPSRIPSFLRAAHCLIAPYSIPMNDCSGRDISRWSSPLKVFQYMAANRPMIVGYLPGVEEVLDSESAIILYDDQVVKWIEAVQYVKEQRAKALILASRAHENFLSNYSWSMRVEKILTSLLGHPSSSQLGQRPEQKVANL